jgi:hypothetical protein
VFSLLCDEKNILVQLAIMEITRFQNEHFFDGLLLLLARRNNRLTQFIPVCTLLKKLFSEFDDGISNSFNLDENKTVR